MSPLPRVLRWSAIAAGTAIALAGLIVIGGGIIAVLTDSKPLEHVSDDGFVAWATRNAIPLTPAAARTDSVDLVRPLVAHLANARVIGLGEGTHGTYEFSALRAKIVEALADQGLTDVFFEMPFARALPIDEYVQGGPGDAEEVVDRQPFWKDKNDEVVALVEWLRRWNAAPGRTRRIHFRGVDPDASRTALECIEDYAIRAGLSMPMPDSATLPMLSDGGYPAKDSASERRAMHALDSMAVVLESQRAARSLAASDEDYAIARQCVVAMREWYDEAPGPGKTPDAVRDSLMAAHTLWWLDRSGPKAKAVYWAHNEHVSNKPGPTWTGFAGTQLRRVLGSAYVPVGFLFGTGSFHAVIATNDDASKDRLGVGRVGAPPPNSLESALLRVREPSYALDLRDATVASAAGVYLSLLHKSRVIGAGFNPRLPNEDESWHDMTPKTAFDVLVFVASATPSHPTPATRKWYVAATR